MKFSQPVTLAKAFIKRIEYRQAKGTARGTVEIRAALTPDIAMTLGIFDSVFTKNSTPRQNTPDKQTWSAGCGAFRALHQPEGLPQSFEFDGTTISDISVETSGKKGLILGLKLHCAGNAQLVELLDYWLKVGNAGGTCKITPAESNQDTIPATAEAQMPLPGAEVNGKRKKAVVN